MTPASETRKGAMRRLARANALQLLYALEYSEAPYGATEASFLGGGSKRRRSWSQFAHDLALRTYEDRESLDEAISKVLRKWKIQRLALTDRLCLRMGLCELRSFPEIPLRVTLNEYIELARTYGTEDSPGYVNGVLDALAKNYAHKDFGGPEPAEAPTPPSQETA